VEETRETLRWGLLRRLEFIDFRLYWDGRINRKNLAETFGISAQQASTDLGLYESRAPHNLRYDTVGRAYVRTPEFRPLYVDRYTDRYLLQLVAIQNGWMRLEDTWFDTMPPVDILGLREPVTNSEVLLRILDAIRGHQQIEIEYSSISGSSDPARTIAPHALAYANGHWYVRAWNRNHHDFRDYNLDRIRDVTGEQPSSINPLLDYEWQQKIDLEVAPHPDLSETQQRAVASEYNMIENRLMMPVRLSLSFYLMTQYNFDVEIGVLIPQKQRLVLLNRPAVENARASARQMATQALSREHPL
jgi:hypothetical protein